MTLTEFYQQISRRLRHQFGRGVRNIEIIVKGEFRSANPFGHPGLGGEFLLFGAPIYRCIP